MDLSNGQLGSRGAIFTVALLVLIVVRFLARELRDRRLPFNRFFATPIIFAFLCAFLIYVAASAAPELSLELTIGCASAVAVGAALGLAVDRFTTVRISADRSAAIVRGSWVTVAVWLGALALRWIGRMIVENVSGVNAGMSFMLNASLLVIVATAATVLRIRLLARAKALLARAPASV